MKKILILIALFMISYIMIKDKEDYYIIPDEAIRFRIVANSNSVYDQYIKNKVKDKLEDSFKNNIESSSSIEETRIVINDNISNYNDIITNIFKDEKYDKSFNINYGLNYFPEKTYNGVKYKEGNYESLLVTIGNGEGDNFWCVLFPPICTLEVEKNTKIEYKFFIQEIIEKYFDKNVN